MVGVHGARDAFRKARAALALFNELSAQLVDFAFELPRA